METYSKYFDNHRHFSQSEDSECMWTPFLSCVHIHALSSVWERSLWPSKYFEYVFVYAFPPEVSSIFGKSFIFPFPYYVLFLLRYFTFHVVQFNNELELTWYVNFKRKMLTSTRIWTWVPSSACWFASRQIS